MGGFAANCGKSFKEILEGISTFKAVKERLDVDLRTAKDRCSAHDFGVSDDHCHNKTIIRGR